MFYRSCVTDLWLLSFLYRNNLAFYTPFNVSFEMQLIFLNCPALLLQFTPTHISRLISEEISIALVQQYFEGHKTMFPTDAHPKSLVKSSPLRSRSLGKGLASQCGLLSDRCTFLGSPERFESPPLSRAEQITWMNSFRMALPGWWLL